MEKIKHAAIRTVDDHIITGQDHGRCIQFAVKLGIVTTGEGRVKQDMQGFMTDKYRFIDRKEALELGLKNGQIDIRMTHNDEAFSEMLWMPEIYYGKHEYDQSKGYFIKERN
jgi:hypothetical protein